MKSRTSAALPALLLLGLAMPAHGALNAYLFLKANGQSIPGSIVQKGREGSILVYSFGCGQKAPYDPITGQPTGKRQYEPIVIRKPIDKSTPLLMQALAQNQNVSGSIKFWTPQLSASTGTGAEVQYYTVDFANARIVSVRQIMENNLDPSLMKFPAMEEVTIVTGQISYTYVPEGITFGDAPGDNGTGNKIRSAPTIRRPPPPNHQKPR